MDERLAAIDLGSNTFRLAIGRVTHDATGPHLAYHDALREHVALSAGLDARQRLSADAQARALAALARMATRIRDLPPARVRAVGTSAFRTARNAAAFLPRAEQALGVPIDVISGLEEARLIYQGVAQDLGKPDERRLVIDIGGGSTELIVGHGTQALALASVPLGCTTCTRHHFPDGRITATRLAAATQAAQAVLAPLAARLRTPGWQIAYGTSGTAKGLLAVLRENGLSADGITRPALERLGAALARAGTVRLADWAGLKAQRAPVLVGGLAILLAAFKTLDIDRMQGGNGALRVGLLHDLANAP